MPRFVLARIKIFSSWYAMAIGLIIRKISINKISWRKNEILNIIKSMSSKIPQIHCQIFKINAIRKILLLIIFIFLGTMNLIQWTEESTSVPIGKQTESDIFIIQHVLLRGHITPVTLARRSPPRVILGQEKWSSNYPHLCNIVFFFFLRPQVSGRTLNIRADTWGDTP